MNILLVGVPNNIPLPHSVAIYSHYNMDDSEMSEETREITVQCPVCNSKQEVIVPVKVIQENIKGVSTIAVNAGCGHSYHIFVDKNFSIRGYQRSDFDVGATAVDNSVVESLSLPGILRLFGSEPFAYTMHAVLLNRKAVLIGSDRQILKSLFINFIELFERELADSADTIEIMSKDDYEGLPMGQYGADLVIDLDFSVIMNNPFKNEKVKLESELLKQAMSTSNVEAQKTSFKEQISQVFLYANVMLNFIYSGTTNYKDIKKAIKQNQKNVPQNILDLAWMIADSRYAMLHK